MRTRPDLNLSNKDIRRARHISSSRPLVRSAAASRSLCVGNGRGCRLLRPQFSPHASITDMLAIPLLHLSRELHLPVAAGIASVRLLIIRRSTMRLPIMNPAELNDAQKPLYDDMKKGIEAHLKGFITIRDDGAFGAPWNPCTREPKFDKPVWELVKAIASN